MSITAANINTSVATLGVAVACPSGRTTAWPTSNADAYRGFMPSAHLHNSIQRKARGIPMT